MDNLEQLTRFLTWLVLPVTLVSLAGCSKSAAVEQPPPQIVQVVDVASSESVTPLHYSASVQAEAQVSLNFRDSGYIESIYEVREPGGQLRNVDEGDLVGKGTVLARLRSGEYQARVEAASSENLLARSSGKVAEAQLQEATASQTEAQLAYERAKSLFANDAMTKAEFDAVQASEQRAQARLASAEAAVGVQKAQLDEAGAHMNEANIARGDTDLRAPFAGVIISRKVGVGDLASQGSPAFVLADTQRVKALFGVPDVALHYFHVGETLPLLTDAVSGPLTGRVVNISASADPTTRIFNISVEIPNEKHLLKIGMIASVEVQQGTVTASLPVIPISAVLHSSVGDRGYAVYVVQGNQGNAVARLRTVRLGAIAGDHITILEGLSVGEHIVADGGLQLADGQRVRSVQTNAGA